MKQLRVISQENADPDLHMVSEALSELGGWESPRLSATRIERLWSDKNKLIREMAILTEKVEGGRNRVKELQAQLTYAKSDAEEKSREASAAKKISEELLRKNTMYQEEIRKLKENKVEGRRHKMVSAQLPERSTLSCGSQVSDLIVMAHVGVQTHSEAPPAKDVVQEASRSAGESAAQSPVGADPAVQDLQARVAKLEQDLRSVMKRGRDGSRVVDHVRVKVATSGEDSAVELEDEPQVKKMTVREEGKKREEKRSNGGEKRMVMIEVDQALPKIPHSDRPATI